MPDRLAIPEGVSISALQLERDPQTGRVRFDWRPIEAICAANGIDIAVLRDEHEDNVAELLIEWYAAHLRAGGARDAVLDQLAAEASAEDQYGTRVGRGP